MRILKKLLKVPALLMLPLFSLLQWIGIFLTGMAGAIMNILAFLFSLVAGASYLMGLASGTEALKMLAVGFVFFILPVIAERIIIGITAIRCNLGEFIRSCSIILFEGSFSSPDRVTSLNIQFIFLLFHDPDRQMITEDHQNQP